MKHPAGKFILKTITFKPYKSKVEEENDRLLLFRSVKPAIINKVLLFVILLFVVISPIAAVIKSISNLFFLDPYEAILDPDKPQNSINPVRVCIGFLSHLFAYVKEKLCFTALLNPLLGIITLIRAPFRSLRTHLSGGYTGYQNIWESESFKKAEDAARLVVTNSSSDDRNGTEAYCKILRTFIYKAQKAVYFQRPGAERLQSHYLRDHHMHFMNMRDSAIGVLKSCDEGRKRHPSTGI